MRGKTAFQRKQVIFGEEQARLKAKINWKIYGEVSRGMQGREANDKTRKKWKV